MSFKDTQADKVAGCKEYVRKAFIALLSKDILDGQGMGYIKTVSDHTGTLPRNRNSFLPCDCSGVLTREHIKSIAESDLVDAGFDARFDSHESDGLATDVIIVNLTRIPQRRGRL